MPRTITLYVPDGTTWYRCQIPEGDADQAYPGLLVGALDGLQAKRPAGSTPAAPPTSLDITDDPNLGTCRAITPAELPALFASRAWEGKGAFVSGAHGPILLDFCVGNARWLEVQRAPDLVARLSEGLYPVLAAGKKGFASITKDDLDTFAKALAAVITAVWKHAPAAADVDAAQPRAVLAPGRPVPGSQKVSSGPVRGAIGKFSKGVKSRFGSRLSKAERAAAAGVVEEVKDWLQAWRNAPTGPRTSSPAAVRTAVDSIQTRLSTNVPQPSVEVEGMKELSEILVYAATALDEARYTVGLAGRWLSLTVVDSTYHEHRVGLPMIGEAAQRCGTYAASSLFGASAGSRSELAAKQFALNCALRSQLVARMPAGLDRARQEGWMKQTVLPAVDLKAEWAKLVALESTPRSPPKVLSSEKYVPHPLDTTRLGKKGVRRFKEGKDETEFHNIFTRRSAAATAEASPSQADSLLDSFPAGGLVAFTPFDEVWLLPDKEAGASYLAAAKRRHDAIPNQDLSWKKVGGYSNGTRWVPMLTGTQLEAPREDTRKDKSKPLVDALKWTDQDGTYKRLYQVRRPRTPNRRAPLADAKVTEYLGQISASKRGDKLDWKLEPTSAPAGPTHSVIPRGALPYAEDRVVREQAFRHAGTDESFDWIFASSPVGFAFKNKAAKKVLLPTGIRVYKFNSDPRLFFPTKRGTNNPTDPYDGAVSPWWSPLDGYEYGSSWGQRMDLARMAELYKLWGERWLGWKKNPQRREPDAPDLIQMSRDAGLPVPIGPMLESGRLTSVVKENWNPLRYICVIRLVQPVYGFFGDFAAMERIDLEPVTKPDNPSVGDTTKAKATLSSWNPVNKAGKDTPLHPEPSIKDDNRLKQPGDTYAVSRPGSNELPGGSTQFYIPNLNFNHFRFVDLKAEWATAKPDRGQAVPDTAWAAGQDEQPISPGTVTPAFKSGDYTPYHLLDLYRVP